LTSVKVLRGRVAVVTGAASGIGLGIASALADEGAHLVLADIDGERLELEAERLRSSGSHVESVLTDVGDPDAVQGLAERTIARYGAVHLLCNNAGILRSGRVWELSLSDWDAVLRVDLMGVVYGLRSFVPLLLASGEEGHVVNVASMASVVPVPGIGPYNVAKHGVLALSETLQAELVQMGAPIGVSVVMPGRVASRIGRGKEEQELEQPSALAPAAPGVIEPAEVGRQVVEAVRQERLYVFTHPERIAEARERFARITGP
jgi:NAD(P)-dependent dehydrogenase (short-subunit alcohol dehydrogenase family)